MTVAAVATAYRTTIVTPIAEMVAVADEEHLLLLEFSYRRRIDDQLARMQRVVGCSIEPGDSPVLARARRELDEYFLGKRTEFTVPLRAPGTPFQTRVWRALQRIPYGTTTSYARVAKEIGQPSAVRAVARANGDNRIAIIIPCHRVIGSDGSLTGYGGGLWRKKKLLELEARAQELSLPGF